MLLYDLFKFLKNENKFYLRNNNLFSLFQEFFFKYLKFNKDL